MPLPTPELQAAEALDRFWAWWAREGMDKLVDLFGSRFTAEQIGTIARAAYLQGQIDGGERVLRTTEEALGLEGCRWCGVPLPPNPVALDPVVQDLGRLCSRCLIRQDEAREVLE